MSLESVLKNLTAAIEANTAAVLAISDTASAPATTTADTPKTAPASAAPAAEAPSKPATPAAQAAPATPAAPAETSGDSIDKVTCTKKVIELAKAKGREAAGKLLAEYNATRVPELDPSLYTEVYNKADALLKQ